MSVWLGLKLLHVAAGVFWIAAALMVGFVIPTARRLGPAAGPVMQHLVNVRRAPAVLSTAALLSTLSGALLLWRAAQGLGAERLGSPNGLALFIGSLSGLAAFLVGLFVRSPNAARLGALTAGLKGPPTPEQGAAIAGL